MLLFRVSTLLWRWRENGGVRGGCHPDRGDPPPRRDFIHDPETDPPPREQRVPSFSAEGLCERASLIHYRRKKRVAVTLLSLSLSLSISVPLSLSFGSCRSSMTSGETRKKRRREGGGREEGLVSFDILIPKGGRKGEGWISRTIRPLARCILLNIGVLPVSPRSVTVPSRFGGLSLSLLTLLDRIACERYPALGTISRETTCVHRLGGARLKILYHF